MKKQGKRGATPSRRPASTRSPVRVVSPLFGVIATIDLNRSPFLGLNPVAIAVNEQTNRVYVANNFTNNVLVIDGSNNSILVNIPVGSNPLGIAVNKATNRIYVTSGNLNNVSVIDGSTNRVTATIDLGVHNVVGPYGIAVNERTNTIYAASLGNPYVPIGNVPIPGTVSIIDGSTDTFKRNLGAGTSPVGVAVHEGTNRIYVSNFGSNDVYVIDGSNNTLTAHSAVGREPVAIAVFEAINRIYVANNVSNDVSAIDGTNLAQPPTTITLRLFATQVGYPQGIAVQGGSSRVWVACGNDFVFVIALGAGPTYAPTIAGVLPVAGHPRAIAINGTAGRIYVANQVANTVSVIQA